MPDWFSIRKTKNEKKILVVIKTNMAYSPSMMYFADRLSGFSTNIFRLEPQSSPTSGPNKLVRFTLPANALLNMRSFTFHFNASATAVGGGVARLPAKIDSLIERVEVSAGGVQLSQGLNFYNVLRHAKDALYGNKNSATLGHPEMVRNISYVDGNLKTADEIYSDASGQCQFAIDHWEGFLGTCEPKILDAALLPELVVTIYLASTNVLSSSFGTSAEGPFFAPPQTFTAANLTVATGNATFELKNMHATIECIGLADAVYDNMVASMIAAKGFIEIPFKQYFSFSTTHTNSSRFTVATQSLDRIWTCFRPIGYDVIGQPVSVTGHLQHWREIGSHGANQLNVPNHLFQIGDLINIRDAAGATSGGIAGVAIRNITGPIISLQDAAGTGDRPMAANEFRGMYLIGARDVPSALDLAFKDCATEKYIGKYFNFSEPTTAGTPPPSYQYQLNGAYYPQFPASAEEMANITCHSLIGYKVEQEMTLPQLKDNYFVQCMRLNMPDSEFSRTISGLDTRAVSLQGYFNTTNVNSEPNLTLFAECTSTLRIGSARQLEIII